MPTTSTASLGKQVYLPDVCVCQTLPDGRKVGWIYPTHYTDGTEIPGMHDNETPAPEYAKAVRCACGRAEDDDRLMEFLWKQAGIPAGPWRFTDYRVDGEQMAYAKESVIAWCSGQSDYQWLFMVGLVGTGKTHLCCAAVSALVGARIHVSYQWVPDLIDSLKRGFEDGSYEEQMAHLRNVEVLVLDDLGAVRPTEWADGEVLKLIDWRYREQAPLLVTTNVKLEQLEARTLDRLQDARLSRLVPMPWTTYRRTA